MSDEFEELVRNAARGMGATREVPTYHGAWRRGRSRRFAKRAVMAAAGALVLVAAMSIGSLRGPNTRTVETDLAGAPAAEPAVTAPVFDPTPTIEAQAGTASVATTAPVGVPDRDPTESPLPDQTAAATGPSPTAESAAPAQPSPTERVAPTPPPPAATIAPTPRPTPAPQPTSPPTPVPTPPLPSPTATPMPAPTAATIPPEPTEPAASTEAIDGTSTREPGPTASSDPAGTGVAPQAVPSVGGAPADAIVKAGTVAVGDGVPCASNPDGVVDATCRLLPEYACAGQGDVRDGYLPLDTDGDGSNDLCRAAVSSVCDTTGDGLGDVACLITRQRNADSEGP